ncbi:MAG: hypothetical protein KAR07_10980, partial [Spirochaetes bacterium]|nr:hypothetical protein [Spirochaetota bacterium]
SERRQKEKSLVKFRLIIVCFTAILIIASCVKTRVDHKYHPFYSFKPGQKNTYNLNINADLSGSVLGFRIREKIRKNLKIIFTCIKYEKDIFKVRVYIKDNGGITRGIVKDAYNRIITKLNYKNGFIIYLTKKGNFLSWVKKNNSPRSFSFLQKLLFDYFFLPSLYKINKQKNNDNSSDHIKINLWKKLYKIKAGVKQKENEIDILWEKNIVIYSSSNINSIGSIKIRQTFSKKLRIIRKSVITAVFKWNLKVKKGILNMDIPVSFNLKVDLNLEPR